LAIGARLLKRSVAYSQAQGKARGCQIVKSGPQRILGIDPGTASVGFGVVDFTGDRDFVCVGSGIIQTSPKESVGNRLVVIRQDMLALIENFKPDVVVIEAIFFFKNAKTVIPVTQARGVIMEACASAGIPAFEYTPMQVKLNLTGFGRADKKEVQLQVARILGHADVIKPDDAADAVALAICHARSNLQAATVGTK
jgi:crossover junction endodeoxyribonuclease RuvC